MYYKIPLSEGAQIFTISLGDNVYEVRLFYRECDFGGWFLDIRRLSDNRQINGIPLMCGTDLLAQHEYLGFGHLVIGIDGTDRIYPNFDDVGTSVNLYWSD